MNKRLTFIINIALGIIIAVKNTMRKKIKRAKLIKVLKTLKIDAIVPFKEKPSVGISEPGKNDEMNASQLFSYFTADIIREDIEFVR